MLQGIPALMTARGSASAASSLLTGLQVYYALSDTSDSSGNGLTLTNVNTVTFSAGKIGDAANFNGTNQQLNHADASQFQMGTGDFSVACWAKFTTSSNQNIAVYGNTGSTGYGIQNNSSGIRLGVSDGSNNKFTVTIHGWNDGNWHFIVGTFSRSGNMICTIDNTTEDTADISTITGSVNNANGFYIGAMVNSGFFGGSVDECGIWNRVLTGAELTTLWNSGTGVTYPFS